MVLATPSHASVEDLGARGDHHGLNLICILARLDIDLVLARA